MITAVPREIEIHNARTHKLRGIDVRIPHGQFTVITGVSGSGKSSLAFETLFAEGQYRFLSRLAGRARDRIQALPRGEVDEITGLAPVISIPQKRPTMTARSTVATMTELLDYLRLLFSRLGLVHCPDCQVPVRAQSPEAMVQQILDLPHRAKIQLLAPMVRDQTGGQRELLQRIEREGFVRIRLDGEIIELAEIEPLDEKQPHSIDVVVDRLINKEGIHQRLTDSLEQVLRLAEGACIALVAGEGENEEILFHRDLNCPSCGRSFLPLEPRSFSWHSAHGACPSCEGTGLESEGQTCADCHGSRLHPVSRAVEVAGMTLPRLLAFSVEEALEWVRQLEVEGGSDERTAAIARPICSGLRSRLQTLIDLGVGYLSLNRPANTLAGGEIQRIRLARCLGTQLQGSCFILDEPTSGLHQRDVARLLKILKELKEAGNTVICVEHHLDAIRRADYLLEFGPGGGQSGGQLIFAGRPEEISAVKDSPTAKALAGEYDVRAEDNDIASTGSVMLRNASLHNLKSVSIEFPLHKLTTVSGVSGSGKSSLILDSLVPLLKQALDQSVQKTSREELGQLEFSGEVRSLQVVDQSPPGGTARSCPATFTGAWDEIRRLLARTRLAKLRGFSEKRFTFNSSAGTCSQCGGLGEIPVKLDLLPQTMLPCPTCRGKRFNSQTLSVTYRGHSPHDLLDMTVAEAFDFWSEIDSLTALLEPLVEIGLDYLKLGQPANTLSGGEAQRLKLARAISTRQTDSLLILDEPTSGLHYADVARFLNALRKIQASGNTILVVEHHPLVMNAADWSIELGPGAGDEGGQLLHCGPPEQTP